VSFPAHLLEPAIFEHVTAAAEERDVRSLVVRGIPVTVVPVDRSEPAAFTPV